MHFFLLNKYAEYMWYFNFIIVIFKKLHLLYTRFFKEITYIIFVDALINLPYRRKNIINIFLHTFAIIKKLIEKLIMKKN